MNVQCILYTPWELSPVFLSPFNREVVMVNAPSITPPNVKRGHYDPAPPTVVPANCFTAGFKEIDYVLSPGIAVEHNLQFGYNVPLGNDLGRHGFVPLSRHKSPAVVNGQAPTAIYTAGLEILKRDGKPDFAVLSNSKKELLCLVQTGSRRVVHFKNPSDQGASPLKGTPTLVRMGEVKSRAGQIVSRELLWNLAEGDAIRVDLLNGWQRVIHCKDGKLSLETFAVPKQPETPAETPATAPKSVVDVRLEQAWKAASAPAPQSRDGGRHALIDIAAVFGGDDLWPKVGAHLREQEKDMRTGVLRHVLEKCPDLELCSWARKVLANLRGVPATTVQKPAPAVTFAKKDLRKSSFAQKMIKEGWAVDDEKSTDTRLVFFKGEGESRRELIHEPKTVDRIEAQKRRDANRAERLAAQPKPGSSAEIPLHPQGQRKKKNK